MNQSEHRSHKFVTVRRRRRAVTVRVGMLYSLDDRSRAALVADLTTVAALLVCTCVVLVFTPAIGSVGNQLGLGP